MGHDVVELTRDPRALGPDRKLGKVVALDLDPPETTDQLHAQLAPRAAPDLPTKAER